MGKDFLVDSVGGFVSSKDKDFIEFDESKLSLLGVFSVYRVELSV